MSSGRVALALKTWAKWAPLMGAHVRRLADGLRRGCTREWSPAQGLGVVFLGALSSHPFPTITLHLPPDHPRLAHHTLNFSAFQSSAWQVFKKPDRVSNARSSQNMAWAAQQVVSSLSLESSTTGDTQRAECCRKDCSTRLQTE